MSDELDVLRREHAAIEPDPQFRAALMDRLRRDMSSGSDRAPIGPTSAPETAAQDAVVPAVQIEPAGPAWPRRHGRWWLAAAAAASIAAVSIAVTQDRDRDPELDTSSDPTQVFTDIRPGSTVRLPPAPIPEAPPGERLPVALVWSGSELIMWSGVDDGDDDLLSAGNGAAFDLSSGTWRSIAPAPIEFRPYARTTWTGTEMFVWGGQVGYDVAQETHISAADGAAYNPTTDTWRRLPDAPIEAGQGCCAMWTGDEVVILGAGSPGPQAAAYDPETNEWRRLGDPPGLPEGDTFWTGETILSMVRMGPDEPLSLLRYDLSTDEWQIVDEDTNYADLVPVTGGNGEVRTVLALPTETGAPVAVLDRAGDAIGTLPGHPGDRVTPVTLGEEIVASGVWVGEEALFSIWSSTRGSYPGAETVWTLNPSTRAWRQLDADEAPDWRRLEPNEALSSFGSGDLLTLVPDAGVLVGDGIAYRPPTPDGG